MDSFCVDRGVAISAIDIRMAGGDGHLSFFIRYVSDQDTRDDDPASGSLERGRSQTIKTYRLSLLLQPRGQFGLVGDKPDLVPSVALAHEVAQSRALIQMRGDIAEYGHADLVGDELLKHLAGDAGLQLKEVAVEARHGNYDEAGAMPPPSAD